MKRYTLSDIKAANEAAGGRFFSRENMKFAGDTMRSFTVCHDNSGSLQHGKVFVKRRIANKRGIPLSMWEFIPETGRLRHVSDGPR